MKEQNTIEKIKGILNSSPNKLYNFDVSKKDKDSNILRKVGDKWEDEEGHIWEQKEGYKVKVSKNHDALQAIRDDLSIPALCPKCSKKMSNWQDKKFYKINKMCLQDYFKRKPNDLSLG